MNRFAWDFRYDAPVQIPGAFYTGDPPRGPLVVAGTYQVKLTVKGRSQTASLEVKLDPRIQNSVTAADMQKQLDLAFKVQQDIDALHRAVNQIRELRTNLQTLQKWAGAGSSSSDVVSAAHALDQKMTPVEAALIQVKMKSSEGNLRYPNELNEQYASFNDLIQGVDGAPTRAAVAGIRRTALSAEYTTGKLAGDCADRRPGTKQSDAQEWSSHACGWEWAGGVGARKFTLGV